MTVLQIPVTKAKGVTVDVDTDALPDRIYQEALKQGLKVIVNGGASKITKAQYPVEAELHAAAKALAEKRVGELLADTLKLGRTSKAADGIPAAVATEARRIAKDIVKQAIKANGGKVSHYSASEITSAANEVIDADPSIVAQAEKNLAERGKLKVAGDILAGLQESPELVAKAEASKAKRKAEREAGKANRAPLSAKQAGKTEHRATH